MSWRAGSYLHEIFLASVGDGLARTRAPGPQAAKLSLCTPEKLVSPDVLANTLSVPHCFSGSTLGTVPMVSPQGTILANELSNFAARAPKNLSFGREAKLSFPAPIIE